MNKLFWLSFTSLTLVFSTACIEVGETTEEPTVELPTPDFEVPVATVPTPTPTPVPELPPAPEVGHIPPWMAAASGLEIEGGAPITNKSVLNVAFFHDSWMFMKVSFNALCEGGLWEAFDSSEKFSPWQPNGVNVMSVQYADDGDLISPCYRAQIVHDGLAPVILFKEYPAPTIEEGENPNIIYEVTDAGGLKDVSCSLNGVVKMCPPGGPHTIALTALPAGDYSFEISAEDNAGNSTTEVINWTVVSKFRHLAHAFTVKDNRKVDIIMIIDNSGSMSYEQKNMAERTSNLLSVIDGLDWQIAVTSTDPNTDEKIADYNTGRTYYYKYVTAGNDGQFIAFPNGDYIIDSSMDTVTAQTYLSNTLQRPETGSGYEMGIRATHRVLERNLAGGSPAHNRLIRDDSHLAAVIISDEDESDNGDLNDPHHLLSFITSNYPDKAFSFHSIITIPDDEVCLKGHGAYYGNRYKTLSDLTGGVIGSVCAADYATQVTGIANGIRDLMKTMTLTCEPVVGFPVTVYKGGVEYLGTFAKDGVNLKFDAPLEPGSYSVEYTCLK